MSIRRITDDEQDQVRAWSIAGVGLAEQARRLNRPVSTLAHTYRQLQADGVIPRGPATRGRDWAIEELGRLEQLLDAGYSYDSIARRLNRSRDAVIVKAKRRGHTLLRTPLLTAGEVARMLGIGCSKTVSRWIKAKWLKARNGASDRAHPIWRIQYLDMIAFLEQADYWMAWEPRHVTDPDIRLWTQELRHDAPRWLTPGEVGQRCGVSARAVYRWIAQGYMPSRRYGNHWINERDLAGWVVPCERSRVGIPRSAGRRVVGKDGLVAREVKL